MHGGSVALSAVWPQCAAEESKVDGFLQDVRRELGMTGRLGRKKEPQATKLHKFIQAINKLVYRTNVSALEALEQQENMIPTIYIPVCILLGSGAEVNAQGGDYGNALQAASDDDEVEEVEADDGEDASGYCWDEA
ncbi:hypothetical protein VE00_05151 [Pseudogymnoascus sp. WSF 3629]|nr:hypothetical protein VE00_05151 [Pseudogymnoascus sp. WSF 3629]